MDFEDISVIEYPSFNAEKEIYSIQQLFDFLNEVTNEQIFIKNDDIISGLYKIRDKALKNDILRAEFKKWYINFLNETSKNFITNPSIVNIISEIFLINFPDNYEANTVLIGLIDSSFECCKMALNIFELYIKRNKKLEPFDPVIRKIFKFLQNMDLRPHCLQIINDFLTNSHILYESTNPDNQVLPFLSTTDDPISISNGLEICRKMIDAPKQKFPNNTCYDFFLSEILKAIIFFANEEFMNDINIKLVTKICIQIKSVEFFYLMEPNELILGWLSAMFLISERYLNQNRIINNCLNDYLKIIDHLIEFWLLPPNLLKIQTHPDFIKWKEDFISLCLSFFLKKSNIQQSLKIDTEIMENSLICENLGKYFSTVHNFKDFIKNQLKSHPRNVGNSILISIFASVLEEREFTVDIRPFKRNDIHTLHRIVKYSLKLPLEPPSTTEQFLFSDAYYRVLSNFSSAYLENGKVLINEKIIDDVSKLYVRTLVNLQADDKSKERLSRGIEAILSVPFETVQQLVEKTQIIPIISELKFNFIYNRKYKEQVEQLFDHLFSIHNEQLDKSLLSSIDFSCSTDIISPNLFVIVRSFFKNCIDEDHNRAIDIVKPIILKSISSQVFLGEVSKTIKAMAEKVFPKKCQSLSLDTVKYVKIIIEFVHLLLEQFSKALPNEEDSISQNVLKTFTNLMYYQPINFGYLSFYKDYCFQEIIDEFFNIFYTKDLNFFCQNDDFVRSFVTFIDIFVDSELENDHLINSLSPIFKKIFDLNKIDQDILTQISEIILSLIDRKAVLNGLLPSILIFKISEEPTLSIFNKMVILLCRMQFDEFSVIITSKRKNFLSDDANELLEYICSELNSEQFEYTSQFEENFNDCVVMIKKLLIYNLIDDNDEVDLEEEEEDVQL